MGRSSFSVKPSGNWGLCRKVGWVAEPATATPEWPRVQTAPAAAGRAHVDGFPAHDCLEDGWRCLPWVRRKKAAFQSAIDADAELILGDRTASAESRAQLEAVQRFGNGLTCALLWLGWGRRPRDLGSLPVIHRSVLERLRLRDRGFGWNVEIQPKPWRSHCASPGNWFLPGTRHVFGVTDQIRSSSRS
jgi:hypothetical protein